MYLYLVRHGQSTGNERQLFFGANDHPLTELGREQAREAAEKLKEVEFTRAWTFRHGCYTAIRVDDGGAELVHFNR